MEDTTCKSTYTKQYFGVDGLNVPGVVTLNGDPYGWMGFSIPLSPTVSGNGAPSILLAVEISMDGRFLQQKAYPHVHDAAVYMENTRLKDGVRKLPLSSSPEYNDNSDNAWFKDWTTMIFH